MPAKPQKDWTLLIFLAGDNSLDAEGERDLQQLKSVDTGGRINIVAQFDRAEAGRKTRRYLLRHGSSLISDMVDSFDETNTGDPAVLEDFLLWGLREYPAKRVMVVIWNHGGGVDDANHFAPPAGTAGGRRGGRRALLPARRCRPQLFTVARPASPGGARRKIAVDDDARDFLDNVELKTVLVNVSAALGRPIDVFGMDACLMSMVEVAWQMRDTVRFIVGSQEDEPGAGWPYDTILTELAAQPDMTPAVLSRTVVNCYLSHFPPGSAVTQSACAAGKLRAVITAVDGLAGALIARHGNRKFEAAVFSAQQSVQKFANPDYVDLHDLCTCLATATGDSSVTTAGGKVQTALKEAVIAGAGSGLPRAHGLSIYFPVAARAPSYASLDFAGPGCRWAGFLGKFIPALNKP